RSPFTKSCRLKPHRAATFVDQLTSKPLPVHPPMFFRQRWSLLHLAASQLHYSKISSVHCSACSCTSVLTFPRVPCLEPPDAVTHLQGHKPHL
ncbi:hypothetical protein GOODEAATRI_032529, partial [Goodea atripinnis]